MGFANFDIVFGKIIFNAYFYNYVIICCFFIKIIKKKVGWTQHEHSAKISTSIVYGLHIYLFILSIFLLKLNFSGLNFFCSLLFRQSYCCQRLCLLTLQYLNLKIYVLKSKRRVLNCT